MKVIRRQQQRFIVPECAILDNQVSLCTHSRKSVQMQNCRQDAFEATLAQRYNFKSEIINSGGYDVMEDAQCRIDVAVHKMYGF